MEGRKVMRASGLLHRQDGILREPAVENRDNHTEDRLVLLTAFFRDRRVDSPPAEMPFFGYNATRREGTRAACWRLGIETAGSDG
jgi:hypothetical protein